MDTLMSMSVCWHPVLLYNWGTQLLNTMSLSFLLLYSTVPVCAHSIVSWPTPAIILHRQAVHGKVMSTFMRENNRMNRLIRH